MSTSPNNRIMGIFVEAIESLADEYCNTTPTVSDADIRNLPADAAAFLGFGGDGVRGNVGVLGDPEAISRIWSNDPPANASDWLRELSNQVVGRFKNRLLRYGKTVQLGTPVLVTGEQISVEGNDSEPPRAVCAEVDGVTLYASLAVELEAGCVLEEVAATHVAEEGSVSLF